MQEKKSLLEGRDASSWTERARRNVHLFVVCSVLLACVALCAALIGLGARELHLLTNRASALDSSIAAVQALSGLAEEVSARVNGSAAFRSSVLTASVNAMVASRFANGTYKGLLPFQLAAARAVSPTALQSFGSAYGAMIETVLIFAYSALASSTDRSSAALLGLMCSGPRVVGLSRPILRITEAVRSTWSAATYAQYLGADTIASTEPCSWLLRELQLDLDPYLEGKSVPTLAAVPTPSSFSTLPTAGMSASTLLSRNASDINQQAARWSALLEHLAGVARDELQREKQSATNGLGFSCAALVVTCWILALAPRVSNSIDSARSDIRSVFREVEATVKLISKYAQVLQTCSVRDEEWSVQQQEQQQRQQQQQQQPQQQQGKGLLWRIVEFVGRVRPFVPQSSFGDLENVPITGQSQMAHAASSSSSGSSALRTDATSAAQAIRELRLRDLRSDMGMQIVNGTVMCLSLSPFHRESDSVGDAAVQNSVAERLSTFLAAAEQCINGTTGVIHSLCGDALIAFWNVTSSTSSPQISAVHSALLLVKANLAIGGSSNDGTQQLSIGITQSFLLAGNIDFGKRKQLAACGPAIALAERLEGCNAAHRTSIMIDHPCAEACANAVIADFDFTIRPVVLLRLKVDADDLTTGYAVYPNRMRQERLKAWNNLFKDLSGKLSRGAFAEALQDIEEYRAKHAAAASDGSGGGAAAAAAASATTGTGVAASAGKQRGRNQIDRSAESWKRNLTALLSSKEASMRLATEFGV